MARFFTRHQEISFDQVHHQLKSTVSSLNKKYPSKTLASFWDFDGTILDGDITEGHPQAEGSIYHGLMYHAIQNQLFSDYADANGFEKFWQDYNARMHDHVAAYSWVGDMFRELKDEHVQKLTKISQEQISQTYRQHFFPFSLQILEILKEENVRPFVISASPHDFLTEVHHFLVIAREDVYGISNRYEAEPFPLQYAGGKVLRLLSLIEKHGVQPAFAFGNSLVSDGPMLEHVAKHDGCSFFVCPASATLEEVKSVFKTLKHEERLIVIWN